MKAQGLQVDREEEHQEGAKCPSIFLHVMEAYNALKFVKRDSGDVVKIYPREMLSWSDIHYYKEATGCKLSPSDVELIMSIDGIFEGRHEEG